MIKGQMEPSDESSQIELLRQIANCLGYLIISTEGLKGQSNRELIPVLDSLGFDRNAIANLLKTTPETVSVRLSQLKANKTKSNQDGSN